MAAASVAQQIVDYVLDYVERVGHFEGRGKKRALAMDSCVVNLTTGESREHPDVLRENVALLIAGKATYTRKRAEGATSPEATPSLRDGKARKEQRA